MFGIQGQEPKAPVVEPTVVEEVELSEDDTAREWLKNNPDDPRAEAVRKKRNSNLGL